MLIGENAPLQPSIALHWLEGTTRSEEPESGIILSDCPGEPKSICTVYCAFA